MNLNEKYYFNPSSTDSDTECYIWFADLPEMNSLIEEHEDIVSKYLPISDLPEYLKHHPKHKIHISALDDVEDKENLSLFLLNNNINLEE